MTNAERILTALDRHLDHPVELTLFGRAALALGFSNPPPAAERSLDVDGIIPASQMAELEADMQFWAALEQVNEELKSEGLYLTHLFQEDQIVLAPGWLQRREPVSRPTCRHLKLLRPAAADLILTKMMRGADDEDLEDIRFLLRQPELRMEGVALAIDRAVLPDVEEVRMLFERAREKVRHELNRDCH